MNVAINLTERARQAVLPFAIVESWGLEVAYERSIKFSPHGLYANRYLLAIHSENLPVADALLACDTLSMPAPARLRFARRYARCSMFFIGFEDMEESTSFRVYLEFEGGEAGQSRQYGLSHIGWKWPTSDKDPASNASAVRTTLYRRLSASNLSEHLQRLEQFSPLGAELQGDRLLSGSPSRRLTQQILRAAKHSESLLICTQVTEAGGRNSYDWNVYAADLRIVQFADELRELCRAYGQSPQQLERFFHIASRAQLGHVAGGIGRDGADFCTLYYQLEES